jgi:hypothetical protein
MGTGDPGGGVPLPNPLATIVPIGVPSLLRISKVIAANVFRTVSPTANPGAASGLKATTTEAAAKLPFTCWPLTATPRSVQVHKDSPRVD